MSKSYDPRAWYWLADDGRLFSSAKASLISKDDAEFLAWGEDGSVPTVWPRDVAGKQTDADLQWVFDNAGVKVFVDLAAYAAAARYAKETGGILVGTAKIDTSRESQAMIANAYQFMQVSGAASTQYKTDSGWVVVSADQMKAIALAAGAHVQACFAAEADIDAKIAAGTIASTADVDAVFAALTT